LTLVVVSPEQLRGRRRRRLVQWSTRGWTFLAGVW
jgi:hypothetical protein